MTSTADGELKPALARQIDHAGNIVRIGHLDNDRWMAIYTAIENGTRLVIIGVAGGDDAVFEILAKFGDRNRRGGSLNIGLVYH